MIDAILTICPFSIRMRMSRSYFFVSDHDRRGSRQAEGYAILTLCYFRGLHFSGYVTIHIFIEHMEQRKSYSQHWFPLDKEVLPQCLLPGNSQQ